MDYPLSSRGQLGFFRGYSPLSTVQGRYWEQRVRVPHCSLAWVCDWQRFFFFFLFFFRRMLGVSLVGAFYFILGLRRWLEFRLRVLAPVGKGP